MNSNVTRIPTAPHSIDAERALLGAVLLEPKAWARICNAVSVEDFYRQDHRLVWEAICTVHEDGAGDDVSVATWLRRAGHLEAAGGQDYLGQLAEDAGSAANVETYARILREFGSLRRLREVGLELVRLVDQPTERTVSETYAEASTLFGALQGRVRVGRGLVDSKTLVAELMDDLDRRKAGQRGLSIGLPDFDAISYGLEPGDLVVIAARPGMGKTSLLVSAAAHVSMTSGVAIFSAEMPSRQLMRRCVARVGGIAQSKLRKVQDLDEVDWQQISEATGALAARRLWIDDTAAPHLDHVRGEVLALAAQQSLGLVMVDYVQLVQGDGRNRHDELRDVAYGLKALAKDANVPIVLLAQLNRGVESRDNKRPNISDLRESGAIEEAADIIGLLYCEGYYDREFGLPNVLECEIAKNRNGDRGHCLWVFNGDLCRVGTIDVGSRSQYYTLIKAKLRGRGKDDEP